jgi:hypothetical protein
VCPNGLATFIPHVVLDMFKIHMSPNEEKAFCQRNPKETTMFLTIFMGRNVQK